MRLSLVIGALVLAVVSPVGALGGPEPEPNDTADPAVIAPVGTERVSLRNDGGEISNQDCYQTGMGCPWSNNGTASYDGRFVAFTSTGEDLVPGDTNGWGDAFVRDRQSGTTERVSVASDGTQAVGGGDAGGISSDGRWVIVNSGSPDLVDDDTNNQRDVFVQDRLTGANERVSVASDGTQTDQQSFGGDISADGRFVTFYSYASNLVVDDTNGLADIFIHDRLNGVTERVSVASDGTESNHLSSAGSMSDDGRFVTFSSLASNLVDDDTNATYDVFLRDREMQSTERISVAPGGAQLDDMSEFPSISSDGRFVAFSSAASNLVSGDINGDFDIFVVDRTTSEFERVSVASNGTQGNGYSTEPHLSDDGRRVAFTSYASNLVTGDTNPADAFVHDRLHGTTDRASITSGGVENPDWTYAESISGDGRHVLFESEFPFVADDENDIEDVFMRVFERPGFLRATTAPALPAMIVVDGVARDSWGLEWVDMDAGPHEVCFGPVPGFSSPPCEEVVVVEGQTTTVEGAYAQRGTLQVTTSPAVASTITVDGHPANDWGVWTDLDPGTYEVCFGPVEDYDPPACEDAVITANATTTITGTFTPDPAAPGPAPGFGYLRAVTDPAVASRITIDGQVADSWGLTWLKLDSGTYEVCFEGVLYATAPACESVEVTAGATTTATGTFTVHGFLEVQVSPALPVTITVDGHPTDAWGIFTSRPPGTYDVCYQPILGFLAPVCEDAVITAGATTTLTGTYEPYGGP